MDTICVYKKIEEENIPVVDCKIDGFKGLIINVDGKCGIFINSKEIESSDEEFMILAHEWGHYASGTLHGFEANKIYVSQCECKADRKAIIEFLPFEHIQDAIKYGCQEVYEFSEFLNLPEEFVVKAFNHYRAMGRL